jgi:Protein of unknown function (DUF3574)
MGLRRLSLLFILSLAIAGFIDPQTQSFAQTPSSPPLETPTLNVIKEELYFGLSLPDGSMISEVQWQQFLREEITPRFREGITVIDAYGQWLDSSQILVRERTKVVILIYPESPDRDRAIQEIIDSYKRKFQQESVLRVTAPVRVAF